MQGKQTYTTNFWELQDRARGRSFLLVLLFCASFALTLVAINLAVAAIVQWDRREPGTWEWLWNPEVCLWTTGATALVILGGCFLKFRELNMGGAAIADMMGGDRVTYNRQSLDETRLLNVVEEMSLAAGIPVPDVFIMKFEFCINAFAAGYTPQDAALGVSLSAIEKLTREELQALVGHEFSHIFNGDMALNMRLTGLVHGLMAVSLAGRLMVLSSFRLRGLSPVGGRLFAPMWLSVGIVFWFVGGIGNLFGRMIQAAINREREYLADASAVQYTRNPGAMAGVLKKAGWYNTWIRQPYGVEANHFLFGDAMGDDWLRVFRTHPRLIRRIRRIEPEYHGDFRRSLDELNFPVPTYDNLDNKTEAPVIAMDSKKGGWAGEISAIIPSEEILARVALTEAVSQVGFLNPAHLARARKLRESLPTQIDSAAHNPMTAVALVYTLLLSEDESVRRRQWQIIERKDVALVLAEARRLVGPVDLLKPVQRLSVVELAMPSLRQLSGDQKRALTECIDELIRADDQINLFEFALEKVISNQLRPPSFAGGFRNGSGDAVAVFHKEGNLLLSALARMTHDDEAEIGRAFEAGVKNLAAPNAFTLLPLADCTLDAMNAAMDALKALEYPDKRRFVEACADVVAADGELNHREADLFRAICAALQIPCPPLM